MDEVILTDDIFFFQGEELWGFVKAENLETLADSWESHEYNLLKDEN